MRAKQPKCPTQSVPGRDVADLMAHGQAARRSGDCRGDSLSDAVPRKVAKKEGAMSTTMTETKPTTALDWAGIGSAVLGVLALATPLGYAVLGGPSVTLSTQDDIRQLLSNGVIATVASAVLGLLGSGLSVPGLMKARTGGRV